MRAKRGDRQIQSIIGRSWKIPQQDPVQALCAPQDHIEVLCIIARAEVVRVRTAGCMTDAPQGLALRLVVLARAQRGQWQLRARHGPR